MSTQKIVVTGVNGFVGKHLVRELSSHDIDVIGVDRADKAEPEILKLLSGYIDCDLSVSWPEINDVDGVIHLAGLAAVGPSFDDPQTYLNINSAILTNLAEYYLAQAKKPRIVVVSSGAIYDPNQAMPLTETSGIGFTSPYALSKVLNENQCAYYRNRGLDCVVARPFNHIGPGQKPGFLLPDLYQQLSSIKDGSQMPVGDLTTRRDYTDVRDVVRAYRLLATSEKLEHNIYNICSGNSRSGNEVLSNLQATMHKETIVVRLDKSKLRPNDPKDVVGNNQRLQKDTGWRPEIRLEQTIADFVKSSS